MDIIERFIAGEDKLSGLLKMVPFFEAPATMASWVTSVVRVVQAERQPDAPKAQTQTATVAQPASVAVEPKAPPVEPKAPAKPVEPTPVAAVAAAKATSASVAAAIAEAEAAIAAVDLDSFIPKKKVARPAREASPLAETVVVPSVVGGEMPTTVAVMTELSAHDMSLPPLSESELADEDDEPRPNLWLRPALISGGAFIASLIFGLLVASGKGSDAQVRDASSYRTATAPASSAPSVTAAPVAASPVAHANASALTATGSAPAAAVEPSPAPAPAHRAPKQAAEPAPTAAPAASGPSTLQDMEARARELGIVAADGMPTQKVAAPSVQAPAVQVAAVQQQPTRRVKTPIRLAPEYTYAINAQQWKQLVATLAEHPVATANGQGRYQRWLLLTGSKRTPEVRALAGRLQRVIPTDSELSVFYSVPEIPAGYARLMPPQ
ncbi:MAG: hypothetical protein LBR05_09495 [Azoarcus sp.]|jgi:hypothetical protein|nr:hypothetical protein [Azoarcus sp.]